MRVWVEATAKECQLEDEPLGSGGEATVHAVTGQPGLAAKLYRKPTAEHSDKLIAMIAAPPSDLTARKHVSIAWPTSRLLQLGYQRFLGYLMPRVHDTRLLYEIFNPRSRQHFAPGLHFGHLLRVARNLAAAVRAIHARGYVIGDVNESNILVNRTALVTLIDTDSFQVRTTEQVFRCRVGKPEYTPPELQRSRFAEVDRGPEHDAFGLAVLIFQLLMQGTHPFTGVYAGPGEPGAIPRWIEDGYFPYGEKQPAVVKPGPHTPPWKVLPPVVQKLMRLCFDAGHKRPAARPTAEDWHSALTLAESELQQCEANAQHRYPGNLADGCPWCEVCLRLGRDPFPALAKVRTETAKSTGVQQSAQHEQQAGEGGKDARAIVESAWVAEQKAQAESRKKGQGNVKLSKDGRRGVPFWVKIGAVGGAAVLVLGFVLAVVIHRSPGKKLNAHAQVSRQAMELPTFDVPSSEPESPPVKVVITAPAVPKDAGFYISRGNISLEKKEYDKAIDDFTEAIRLDAASAVAYYKRGLAWFAKKEYDKAIQDYTKAIRLDSKYDDAFNSRGLAWIAKAEYDKAIQDIDEAIQIDSGKAVSYLNRGDAWLEKKDFDKAIMDFSKAIRLDSKYASAFIERGTAWLYKGEYDKAIQDLGEAIRLDRQNVVAHCTRGLVWVEKKDYDKAILDFTEAIRLDPKKVAAYSNRGDAWRVKSEYDKAIQDFDEAIRLDPNDAEVYTNRGRAWLGKQEYDKAIQDFGEAIRLDPKEAATYCGRGDAWRQKKEYEKAIQDYDKAIALDPRNATAYLTRGLSRMEKKEYDKAIQDFTAAIRLDPKNAAAHCSRGIAWGTKEEYDKAIADFTEAIRLDPKNALAYHGRGLAWNAKKDRLKAAKDFEIANQLDPKKFPK